MSVQKQKQNKKSTTNSVIHVTTSDNIIHFPPNESTSALHVMHNTAQIMAVLHDVRYDIMTIPVSAFVKPMTVPKWT